MKWNIFMKREKDIDIIDFARTDEGKEIIQNEIDKQLIKQMFLFAPEDKKIEMFNMLVDAHL
jgi:hypothetical protein